MKDLRGNVCRTSKFMRQSLSELHGNEMTVILHVHVRLVSTLFLKFAFIVA